MYFLANRIAALEASNFGASTALRRAHSRAWGPKQQRPPSRGQCVQFEQGGALRRVARHGARRPEAHTHPHRVGIHAAKAQEQAQKEALAARIVTQHGARRSGARTHATY